MSAKNDYYPFGMQMPERKFDAGKYRYGFNGKENDNDVKGEGNQQDYGMRIYDSRLGKFLSVDPITKKYPELSPFQFASNTPIQATDLDGLEADFSAGKLLRRKVYKDYGNLLHNIVGNTIIENNLGNNLSVAVQNQVIDGAEGLVNLFSSKGREKLLQQYGYGAVELMIQWANADPNERMRMMEDFISNPENIENLAASGFLAIAGRYIPALKIKTSIEISPGTKINVISQNITGIRFNSAKIFKNYTKHIFSADHMRAFKKANLSPEKIIEVIDQKISSNLKNFKEGDNYIFTEIDGNKATVTAHVRDNEVISIDGMLEHKTVRNPNVVNVIYD